MDSIQLIKNHLNDLEANASIKAALNNKVTREFIASGYSESDAKAMSLYIMLKWYTDLINN